MPITLENVSTILIRFPYSKKRIHSIFSEASKGVIGIVAKSNKACFLKA